MPARTHTHKWSTVDVVKKDGLTVVYSGCAHENCTAWRKALTEESLRQLAGWGPEIPHWAYSPSKDQNVRRATP